MGRYKDELTRTMTWLGQQENVVFIGQSVLWDGHSLFKTLVGVPDDLKVEFPVAEDFQMGLSIGVSLNGLVPVSIFPRWDFLILATNQLVNHLDKFKLSTDGEICPKVIIRTCVGSIKPLFPGYQHMQDHSDGFEKMLQTVELIRLVNADDIFNSYRKAYERTDGRSTLLVEYGDLYNE